MLLLSAEGIREQLSLGEVSSITYIQRSLYGSLLLLFMGVCACVRMFAKV